MAKKITFKIVPIPGSEEFIKALGIGIRKAGFENRSEFIREAIAEKFAAMGVRFPRELVQLPQAASRKAARAKLVRK